MRDRRAWSRRAAVALGTALTLGSVPASPTAAQTGGGPFVGYEASASGTALSAFPTVPALLPVDVPLEATIGLATATISSGGQGFGRASTFFPGSLAAGLRPLIEQAAGVRLPLPDYPIVVEAREFEEAKRSEVPGVTMTADVDPERSVAVADTGAVGLQALLGVRAMRTESRTVVEGGTITARSTTHVEGLDLAGVLSIGTLVSESSVSSDGVTSTCAGRVTIGDAVVAGTPVTIDDDGVHVQGSPVLPGLGLGALVERLLSGAGLEVRALGGDDACDGSFGSRTSAGLFVRLPLPAFGPIPAGGGVTLVVGSTSASAGASVLPDEEPAADGPAGLADVVTRLPGPSGGGAALPPVAAPPTARPVVTGGETALPPLERAAYDFDGIPLSLVVGLGLLVVAAAGRLRRYMDRVLALVGPP